MMHCRGLINLIIDHDQVMETRRASTRGATPVPCGVQSLPTNGRFLSGDSGRASRDAPSLWLNHGPSAIKHIQSWVPPDQVGGEERMVCVCWLQMGAQRGGSSVMKALFITDMSDCAVNERL